MVHDYQLLPPGRSACRFDVHAWEISACYSIYSSNFGVLLQVSVLQRNYQSCSGKCVVSMGCLYCSILIGLVLIPPYLDDATYDSESIRATIKLYLIWTCCIIPNHAMPFAKNGGRRTERRAKTSTSTNNDA